MGYLRKPVCMYVNWNIHGTGSYPEPPQGWQRRMRLTARQNPLKGPCFLMAVFRNLEFSKYQVTRFVLNENFGSILDCWAAFGGISSIKEDTLNYLRGTLWPKMSVCELANDKFLTVNEVLLPQEIVMLVIAPLSYTKIRVHVFCVYPRFAR